MQTQGPPTYGKGSHHTHFFQAVIYQLLHQFYALVAAEYFIITILVTFPYRRTSGLFDRNDGHVWEVKNFSLTSWP